MPEGTSSALPIPVPGQMALPVNIPASPAPALFGQVITSFKTGNTYTIGSPIGEGNFGWVYNCTDMWDNDLAAKVLKPNFDYQTVKDRATKEFQTLFVVRHPYVTYVHDAFEFEGRCYIITERYFRPVFALFEMNRFDGSLWIKPIARCLLQAVHFIHLTGLAHKDIHGGNVFTNFQRDAVVPDQHEIMNFKLGDLCIANVVGNWVADQTTFANWMRPPEAHDPHQFGPMDHRVDIYHCGLLFLQILAGRELRFTPQEILAGAPRQMALHSPLPYSIALEKALRRHVQHRTANAQEFWRDLNSAVTGNALLGHVAR